MAATSQSGWHERGVGERQGGDVRRPPDGAVSDQMLKQFAANFAARGRRSAAVGAAVDRGRGRRRRRHRRRRPTQQLARRPRQRRTPLNGIALVWAVIKNWLRGLFGEDGMSAASIVMSRDRRAAAALEARRLYRRAAAGRRAGADARPRASAAGGRRRRVGKTEVAVALATVRNTRLIRLQCYEGLDAQAAITSGTMSGSCWRSSCTSTTSAAWPRKSRTYSPSATC